MPIQPTHQQLGQLTQALLGAFDHAGLTRLLRNQLELDLEWVTPVAGRRDLTTIVENLTAWFAAQEDDGLQRLLTAALAANPHNPRLAALAAAWRDITFAPLPLPQEHPALTHIETGGGSLIQGDVQAGADFVGRDKNVQGDEFGGNKFIIQGDYIVHVAAETPASDDPEPPTPGESPYQGLHFFDVADADRFFGRERLSAQLAAYLRDHRFLAVIGASGSGKSSLVRAGLVPALQKGQPLLDGILPPAGCAHWPIHMMTPKAHPLEQLAGTLTRDSDRVKAQADLMDDLASDARSLHLYATRLVGQQSAERLLLVVDQFEELFTLCRDAAERRAFVENLLTASQPDGVTTVVLTLRADFYHRCADPQPLRMALQNNQFYIGPMSRHELRMAIEEPARRHGWTLEDGLVEQLLRDVADESGALPLLSHALLETWRRRRGHTLTLAGYAASGRVQGAIAQSAEAVFSQQLSPAQRSIARTIFVRLTELGEGVQDTRRRVTLAELIPQGERAAEVEAVLKTLADARLITTDRDASSGQEEAEVAHEALIREWGTLREWLADDREGLRIHRHLTEACEAWRKMQRDPGELYRGARLDAALTWAESHADDLNAQEREFLDASQIDRQRQIAEREQIERELEQGRQRELRRTRFALLAALAALVAIGVIGVVFYNQYQADRAKVLSLDKLEEARSLRTALDAKGAIAAYEEAASLNPELDIDVDLEAANTLRDVATGLTQIGEEFAKEGDYELAFAKLRRLWR